MEGCGKLINIVLFPYVLSALACAAMSRSANRLRKLKFFIYSNINQ